jgi:hypothetical protein
MSFTFIPDCNVVGKGMGRHSGRPDQTIAGIIIGLESAADREGSPGISGVEGKADITRTSAKVHS